jgi:outer membrane lipoprotein SlyB
MIYFRPGAKERTVGVSVTNANFPGLPVNLRYLKQTDELLEDLGYTLPDNPSMGAVQVHVTANYTLVDNSQAIANEMGGKTVAGAALGALTGFIVGGGRGAADGAAGGAAVGLASGTTTPPAVKYLTVGFNIYSKRGGTQTGQITKDISNIDMGPEQFIDAVIADYLEAALAKRH